MTSRRSTDAATTSENSGYHAIPNCALLIATMSVFLILSSSTLTLNPRRLSSMSALALSTLSTSNSILSRSVNGGNPDSKMVS